MSETPEMREMNEQFLAYVDREIPGDAVLITCGLPATNKTETTEIIAREKGYQILRTDLIRLEVLDNEDIFDEKAAASMSKRGLVYDEMFRRAGDLASRSQGVILDATFVTQALRRRAAEVAAANGKTFIIQQTSCTEEFSLAKIAKRSKENYESNALSPQAYFNNVAKFETIDLDALKTEFPDLHIAHLVVDTNSDEEVDWRVIGRTDR